MAINYPGSLDDFTNPSAGNTLDSPSHSGQHSDLNDAVEALEAKVGIGASPAGSATAGQVLTAQGGGTAIWATPDATGLVHINTTTAVNVASQSFDNVFSSTYDDYRILIMRASGSTSLQSLNLRFRKSGSDNSSNIYYRQIINGNNTTLVGERLQDTSVRVGLVRDQGEFMSVIDLSSPYEATIYTTGLAHYTFNDVANIQYQTGGFRHNLNSSADFDGFTLFPASGNFTARISIYGYRK